MEAMRCIHGGHVIAPLRNIFYYVVFTIPTTKLIHNIYIYIYVMFTEYDIHYVCIS